VKNIARKSLEITSLFEAELLVRLMLWRWNHPLADDADFAQSLLENASEALRHAAGGEQLIESVPAIKLNFVAAIWYAENCAIAEETAEPANLAARQDWLAMVRRALPSCFCDPSDLGEV
jgi:hypothetical protein